MGQRTRIGAEAALAQLPSWKAVEGRDAIAKTFRFKSFGEAWAFMSSVAAKAEAMDHHPEWFNVYDRVDVTLATHSAKGVTELDVELARYMDSAATLLGA